MQNIDNSMTVQKCYRKQPCRFVQLWCLTRQSVTDVSNEHDAFISYGLGVRDPEIPRYTGG
jgi:hypothetical protein